jgi:hypothetical protein
MEMRTYPDWKEAVVEANMKFSHGDIITIEWLRKAFDLRPPAVGTAKDYADYQLKFLSSFDNFRDTLLTQHNKYLQNIRGQGYLVVAVENQTATVWNDFTSKVKKTIASTYKGLTCIDYQQLSSEGIAANNNKLAILASLSSFTKKRVFLEDKNGNGQRPRLPGGKEIRIPNKTAGHESIGNALQKAEQAGA